MGCLLGYLALLGCNSNVQHLEPYALFSVLEETIDKVAALCQPHYDSSQEKIKTTDCSIHHNFIHHRYIAYLIHSPPVVH